MANDAILLCFEIDDNLYQKLVGRINDPRIKLVKDGAENLGKYLAKNNLAEVDCIISGLPLVSLPKKKSAQIITQIIKYLKRGGKYIQFQYSLTSFNKFKKLFSNLRVRFTLLNIPPAFIYACKK